MLNLIPVLAVALLYAVCALTFMRYPRATTDPWLDPSYEEAYAYFLKSGAQAGVDYAFTYGPLGHFLIPRFDPDLFYLDAAVIVGLALAAAVPLAVWGYRHRNVPAMAGLAAVITCLVPGTAGPEIGYVIAVAAATLLLLHSPQAGTAAYTAAGGFFAFLALTKFTLLVLNTAAVGALALHLLFLRRYWPLAALAGAYGAFLAAFWLAAGQNLTNFVPYVVSSLKISEAYNAGMYLPGREVEVWLGVVLWVLMLAHLLIRRPTTRSRGWAAVLPLLFVVFVMLLTWKMGIVRQQSHINKFYVTVAALPFFLPYTGGQPLLKKLAYRVVPILVVVLGSSGYFIAKSTSPTGQIYRASKRLVTTAARTANLPGVYENRLVSFRTYRRLYGLATIRELVGRSSVDVFSANQAVAVFNEFNYRPRPVFQGYQACTPELMRWNGSFYAGPAAPEYVLYIPGLTPIDNRYPASEDAETLKRIFLHYRPVHYEGGLYLLQRTREEVAFEMPDVPLESARLGQWIEAGGAGDRWQLLELHLAPTLAGELRALVFKPPVIEMLVRFEDGSEEPFRINIGSIETGFILNPYFGVLETIEQWPLGEGAKRVDAFQVRVESAAWAIRDELSYRLATVPPLASAPQVPRRTFDGAEN